MYARTEKEIGRGANIWSLSVQSQTTLLGGPLTNLASSRRRVVGRVAPAAPAMARIGPRASDELASPPALAPPKLRISMLAVASGPNLPFPSTRTAVLRLVYAPLILLDRHTAHGRDKFSFNEIPRDHVYDPEAALTALARLPRGEPLRLRVPRIATSTTSDDTGSATHTDATRRKAIEHAYHRVVAMRRAFDACAKRPHPDGRTAEELRRLAVLPEEVEVPIATSKASRADDLAALARQASACAMMARNGSQRLMQRLSFSEFILCCDEFDKGQVTEVSPGLSSHDE